MEILYILTNPAQVTISAGSSEYLHATAVYEDGESVDVTSYAEWFSSDEGVATVQSNGIVTGITEGSAKIVPLYLGIYGTPSTVEVIGTTAFTMRPERVNAGSIVQINFYFVEDILSEDSEVEIHIEGVESFGEENTQFSYFDMRGERELYGTFIIPPYSRPRYMDVVIIVDGIEYRRNDYLTINPVSNVEEITFPFDDSGSIGLWVAELYRFIPQYPWTAYRFSSGSAESDNLVPYTSMWLFDHEATLLLKEDSFSSESYENYGILNLDFAVDGEDYGNEYYLILTASEMASQSDITGDFVLNGDDDMAEGIAYRTDDELPIEIPEDGSILNSMISISDTFTISDLKLYIRILHPSAEDLIIDLIPPSGCSEQINIKNRSEGGLIAIYDLFRGVDDPADSLDNLNGCSPAGDWVLSIEDMVEGNSGTLENWALIIL